MERDFSKIPNYSKRQIFLDPAGKVTTQRYDNYAFPVIAKFADTQRGQMWIPEEISLTQDKQDFRKSGEDIRHVFTSNLLRQTTLDSALGRTPTQIFNPVISIPEMEELVQVWTYFEMIHSKAYSHIIKNIYDVSADVFDKIHNTTEIVSMASSIHKHFDELHFLNCQMSLAREKPSLGLKEPSEYEMLKAIWKCLITCYGLEAIRFTSSFGTSLAMVENRLFIGNGNEISLIMADEMLHTDFTKYIINLLPKVDARFKQVSEELKKESYDMLIDVVDEEKAWSKYLFKHGSILGMNSKVWVDLVDWTAQYRLKDIHMKYEAGIKQNPTPWFAKYFDNNKKQTALQENESTSYLIGILTNDINEVEFD